MKNIRQNRLSATGFKRSVHVAFAAILVVTLAACQTPQQELYADQDTCANMGARFGSPSHTACMLQQQQRRDQAHLLFLEEARINSELARNAQEMRDRNRSN